MPISWEQYLRMQEQPCEHCEKWEDDCECPICDGCGKPSPAVQRVSAGMEDRCHGDDGLAFCDKCREEA